MWIYLLALLQVDRRVVRVKLHVLQVEPQVDAQHRTQVLLSDGWSRLVRRQPRLPVRGVAKSQLRSALIAP